MQKRKNLTTQLCVNAVLIALFYVLDMFSIRIGNSMEITFDGLPVIIAGIFFGPVSGITVGMLGALLGQLAAYGLGPTTILWILPAGIRGLVTGGLAALFRKKNIRIEANHYPLLVSVIVASSLIVTAVMTAVMYADAKIYGYYTKEVVFGLLVWRIISSVITAVIYSVVVPLILKPLDKAID